ncbi:unnamed protein product, partial [Staurois parvus]
MCSGYPAVKPQAATGRYPLPPPPLKKVPLRKERARGLKVELSLLGGAP